MKMKKILVLIMAVVMISCSLAITASADKIATDTDTVCDWYDDTQYIQLNFRVQYYSGANCVKATNTFRYRHSLTSQYNLPSFIEMTVVDTSGSRTTQRGQYMTSAVSTNELLQQIETGYVFKSANVTFKVNKEVTHDYSGETFYANYNYTNTQCSLSIVNS